MERPTDRIGSRFAGAVGAVAGGVVGGVAGLIVAVNLVIYLGPDQGYESSIRDVFDDSKTLGVVTVAVLIAGPVFGVILARRLLHQNKDTAESTSH